MDSPTPQGGPLLQLPTELCHEIALHLQLPADLCHLESSCHRLLHWSRSNETLWRALVERRWGCIYRMYLGGVSTGRDGRTTLCWLETVVRPVLHTSVRGAIEMMASAGLLESAGAWSPCVWRLLTWTALAERRRLAAFVCADWQPRLALRRFLERFDLRAPTPEASLRQLLFAFPFLPIDAGSGADRVIGEFARQYVLANPQAVHDMRRGSMLRRGRHRGRPSGATARPPWPHGDGSPGSRRRCVLGTVPAPPDGRPRCVPGPRPMAPTLRRAPHRLHLTGYTTQAAPHILRRAPHRLRRAPHRLGGQTHGALPSSSDDGDGDDGDGADDGQAGKYAGVDRRARDGVYALLYSVRPGVGADGG